MSVFYLDDSILKTKLSNEKQLMIVKYILDNQLSLYNVTSIYCENLINNYSKLTSEVELLIVSYLHLHNIDSATKYYKILDSKFPSSNRVRLLKGMILEFRSESKSFENNDEALQLYSNILHDDPGNERAWKRRAARLYSLSAIQEAVHELNEYLSVYPSDEHAWLFLSNIYLKENKLHLAKFCSEELILLNSTNYLYYLYYADILYSIGSTINFELSLKYYLLSLSFNESSIRAMYGALLSIRTLHSITSSTPSLNGDISISQLLVDIYKRKNPDMLFIVESFIESL